MKRHSAPRRRPPISHARPLAAAATGALLLCMSATAQDVARVDQAPAFVDETTEASATIMDIEPETRRLSLRTEDGREFSVQAGEEVARFDELEVGDTVNVTYYEALAAEITTAPPGEDAALIDTGQAPVGGPAGRGVGMVYTAIVTIDDVDTETNIVSFTDPNGEPREILVQRPQMQQFIAGLSEGDRVRVTYGEALAISVTPAD